MTTKRKQISKRIRFEVFKLDNFTCQYCGISPPAGILEVDHINPVSRGGGNNRDNLITSCFDCNRGKSNVLLTALPETVIQKAELIAEKLAQIKAYDRLIKSRIKYEKKQVLIVEEIFKVYFKYTFTDRFNESVRVFLQKLPIDAVSDFMHIACKKGLTAENTIKYFCGICWKNIRGDEDA